MGQAPELKNKLESAIRCSQQQQAANLQKMNADSKENKNSSTTSAQTQQQQQPTIKLKTDFSNFS